MIKFTCSKCAQGYSVPNEYSGKRVRCKGCNSVNTVPTVATTVTVKSGDSIAAYNDLLLELSKAEKQAPAVDEES